MSWRQLVDRPWRLPEPVLSWFYWLRYLFDVLIKSFQAWGMAYPWYEADYWCGLNTYCLISKENDVHKKKNHFFPANLWWLLQVWPPWPLGARLSRWSLPQTQPTQAKVRKKWKYLIVLIKQCYRKTFMVHQTFVWWASCILFKIVKSLIRHFGLAIANGRHVRWFSWALIKFKVFDESCSVICWMTFFND